MGFGDIEKAYWEASKNVLEYESGSAEYVYLLKSKQFRHEFNLDVVRKLLIDYIESKNSLGIVDHMADVNKLKYNDRYVHGISCYTLLIEYIQREKDGANDRKGDNRPFTFLNDNKKINFLLCKFLFENKVIKDANKVVRSENIFRFTNELLNLFIKYNISQNVSVLDRAVIKVNNLIRDAKKQ